MISKNSYGFDWTLFIYFHLINFNRHHLEIIGCLSQLCCLVYRVCPWGVYIQSYSWKKICSCSHHCVLKQIFLTLFFLLAVLLFITFTGTLQYFLGQLSSVNWKNCVKLIAKIHVASSAFECTERWKHCLTALLMITHSTFNNRKRKKKDTCFFTSCWNLNECTDSLSVGFACQRRHDLHVWIRMQRGNEVQGWGRTLIKLLQSLHWVY